MRYNGDRPPKEFDLDTIDNKTSMIKIHLQLKAKQTLRLNMASTKAV
jgi:hypothetical protein